MAGGGHREGLPPSYATLLLPGTHGLELQWFFLPVLGPLQLETDFGPALRMGQLKPGPHSRSGGTRIATQSGSQDSASGCCPQTT